MDSNRNGASHRHGSSHASHRPLVEEQPGLEVYHPPAARDNAANAPEVYFSEDINPSQYTFYREGTPTPPEDGREKRFSGGWAVPPPSIPDSSAAYPQSDDPHVRSARVCGIQRRLLWVVIPVIFFLVLAIAIGIGVGVGVGRHSGGHSAASTSTPGTSSSASLTPTTSTAVQSSTQSSPSPTATSTSAADCPSGNNTIYSVSGSDKKFLQLCGVDYSGTGEAVDLANVLTANMQECMDNCAGFTGCTACGWGVIDGDKGDDHRCWLKSDLGNSHKATSDWSFAILQ